MGYSTKIFYDQTTNLRIKSHYCVHTGLVFTCNAFNTRSIILLHSRHSTHRQKSKEIRNVTTCKKYQLPKLCRDFAIDPELFSQQPYFCAWKIAEIYGKKRETELCQSSTRGHRWCCFRRPTYPLMIRLFISFLISLWVLVLSCKKTTANMLFNENLVFHWKHFKDSLFISRGVDFNSSDTLVLIVVRNKWAVLLSAV